MEEDRIRQLEQEVCELRRRLEGQERENSLAIVCFSGEWDRLFAAFTIANGALAMGMQAHLFLTFWGATAARNGRKVGGGEQDALQRAFSALLPATAGAAPLSRFHFFGLGKIFMRRLMKKKGVEDLPQLIASAIELGVHLHFCDTSLSLFGWSPQDLEGGDKSNWCGVSTFLNIANRSKSVLFI